MMRRRSWRIRALLGGMFLLTGCSHLAPAPEGQVLPAQTAQQRFTVSGKLSVRHAQEHEKISLRWVQDADRSRLWLTGAMGMGGAVVDISKDVAQLQLGDREYRAADAEQLLRQHLELQLPVTGARYWIQGLPWPQTLYSEHRDDQGLLRQLHQSGWQVQFDGYRQVQGVTVPGRVQMSRPGLQLRFVATGWWPHRAELVADE